MPHYPQSDSIHKFFGKGQPLTFGKCDVILGNENTPDGVYCISTGYVKVYSITDKGDENLHIIYGPGEIFPLIWAYLGTEPEFLFYEAIATSSLWRVSRQNFQEHVDTNHDFAAAMTLQVTQQFRIFVDRVDNLEYKTASERVAYQLLFLVSRFGSKQDGVYTIEAPITHEGFANSVNLARESVSRELEKLIADGYVEKRGTHIVIEDINRLAGTLSRPVNLQKWYLD